MEAQAKFPFTSFRGVAGADISTSCRKLTPLLSLPFVSFSLKRATTSGAKNTLQLHLRISSRSQHYPLPCFSVQSKRLEIYAVNIAFPAGLPSQTLCMHFVIDFLWEGTTYSNPWGFKTRQCYVSVFSICPKFICMRCIEIRKLVGFMPSGMLPPRFHYNIFEFKYLLKPFMFIPNNSSKFIFSPCHQHNFAIPSRVCMQLLFERGWPFSTALFQFSLNFCTIEENTKWVLGILVPLLRGDFRFSVFQKSIKCFIKSNILKLRPKFI